MTLRAPEPLATQHRLESFGCGKPALNDWLSRHARQAQGSGSAKTIVVAEDDGRVGGYFSLTVGQVDTLGFGLLQDGIRRTMLIAEQAGIRAMLTHPIDEAAARFYTRFGFIASPLREPQLLLLLKDARRWVR